MVAESCHCFNANISQMGSKIALITGGSRGLGENTALQMARKGYDVIITYHTKLIEANAVVAEIETMDRKAAAIYLDMSDFNSLDGFIFTLTQTLKEKWEKDKFDFLINNAGHGATIPYMQATEADFDKFMNVHFKSVYFLTQKALPMMNDGGSIVNLSSGTTRFANPGYSMYASMKGAMEVFTRYLAKEAGPRGITANIVAPGPVETDFNNASIRNNPKLKEILGTQAALGRVGHPEDIGGVIAFLCTREGHWITGQRIEASGGISL